MTRLNRPLWSPGGLIAVVLSFSLVLGACGGSAGRGQHTSSQDGDRQGAGAAQGTGGAGNSTSGYGKATDQQASGTVSASNVKVAMILPGTVEDADYNFVGYRALQDLEKEFGVLVKHQERVAPADAERVARGFVGDGYNVIAFHGGQYVTTVKKLAPQFPDVTFIMESAGEIPDLPGNVWNIGRKFYQGFYPLGVLGAKATKSGKIGVIAGIKLPDFVASINSVKEAARSVRSDVEVLYTFVGDQNDPVKARQAAEAQISAGADVLILLVNLGAFGVIEAVKDKPVLITTYYTDKTSLAPKNFATSVIFDFGVPYKAVMKKVLGGQKSGYEEMRPGNGMSLGPVINVPDEAAKLARETFDKIALGELKVREKADTVIED